jgi:hypothetical protein
MLHGQCHCGAIQFEAQDEALHSAVCYCNDCRRQSGAPLLAWAMFPKAAVSVKGEPRVYHSSATGRRSFCSICGTGLFFTNGQLDQMGMMQVRVAALDNPDAIAPKMQVQTAERADWMASVHALPAFERFPG